MNVEMKHIASRKRIGTLHGQPVTEVLLKGGLHLVTAVKEGKPRVIGAGPHRAVARWIAEKNEPDVQITELSKDEQVSEAGCRSVEAQCQGYVSAWNQMLDQLPQ